MSEQKHKEPILAAFLNFLIGGGGYLYIGQMTKGAVFIAGAVLFGAMACCLGIVMASAGFGLTLFGALACIPLLFWGLIAIGTAWDGYSLIQRVNEGHTLGNWEFFFSRK
jgi:hypothetical protein